MMDTISTILNRSVAGPFYRQHAGLFLFLFFILVGIQTSFYHILQFHYAIIENILTATDFFLFAFLIWLLYALKIFLFFNNCVKKEAYHFLQVFNAIEGGKRFIYLLWLQVLLFAPAGLYGLIILFVAIKEHHFAGGLKVALAMLVLCGAVIAACYKAVQKSTGIRFFAVSINPLVPLPANISSFVLRFIFRKQFPALVVTKLLTFSCLYFFVKTDPSVYESRMLWMLYITSLAAHCVIIYRNHHFMETELSFYRNFPVRGISTLISLLGVYIILLIPEIWALKGVVINQNNAMDYVWMVLTGPSLLLMLHCLLYTEDMAMEEYLKLLFGVWIVFLFFSFSNNHWLLPAIGFTFSTIIFFTSYYNYQKNTQIEGLD